MNTSKQMASGLGMWSIALGTIELTTPRNVSDLIGVSDSSRTRALMRSIGMRELVTGAGLLSRRPRPLGWAWARVVGDVMDMSLLMGALTSKRARRRRVAVTLTAVFVITAVDMIAGTDQARHRRKRDGKKSRIEKPMRAVAATTVNKPVDEVYKRWHDFEDLPTFMEHLESVRVLDDGRSHWKAKALAGGSVEWDAEIIRDKPNEMIEWRSVGSADVRNSGVVRFERAPGDRGTEVHVELEYDSPGGPIGTLAAKAFGEEPDQQLSDDLYRFKQMMEVGEIVRSEGTPAGNSTHRQLKQRPAQPLI